MGTQSVVDAAQQRGAVAASRAGERRHPAAYERADVTEHGLRLVLVVAGVMAAALMQTLDTTISNIALPTIQGNLGASQDAATWVVTAYTIAAIIVIPLTPWLQNRFGRKNYFLASIVGFTLASIACGFSGSLQMLVISRVVQGAFGGGLLATSQAILRDTFPPEQLGISQAIFALGAILGPALGPWLGGVLVDNYSWNWVFDINVLPGAVATGLLLVLLRDPTAPVKTRVDVTGLGLLAVALGTMQYVLTEGERNDWFQSPVIFVAALLCVAALCAFVVWELWYTDVPIVDLSIFRNRSVAVGSLMALLLGAVIFGSTYTLPQLTQGPLGFTPTLSGELFILRALPIFVCTFFVPAIAAKVDTRWLLATGFLLMAYGNWRQVQVTTSTADFWTFALPLVLIGIASALLFVPISIAVLGATTPSEGPKAGAMINLATQLGGSISVALLDVLIDRRMEFHTTQLDATATLANPNVSQFLHQGGSWPQLAQLVDQQALVLSYADATVAAAVVAVACVPLVFFMRRPKAPHGPVEVGG